MFSKLTLFLTLACYFRLSFADSWGCTKNSINRDSLKSAQDKLREIQCANNLRTLEDTIISAWSDDGSVVAFMCNYGDDGNLCSPDEASSDWQYLGKRCDDDGAWLYHSDWAKIYGYDSDWPGDDICHSLRG